jgi:hypothetical protein
MKHTLGSTLKSVNELNSITKELTTGIKENRQTMKKLENQLTSIMEVMFARERGGLPN